MFEGIKLRWFIAKVKAELKAQYDNEEFVTQICNQPSNIEQLTILHKHAYYRKHSIAPFIASCHILHESLLITHIPLETKNICATLLAQRLQKALSDRHFHLQHIMIFGELEQKLADWHEENNFDLSQND